MTQAAGGAARQQDLCEGIESPERELAALRKGSGVGG
jgi:hypothetical protein